LIAAHSRLRSREPEAKPTFRGEESNMGANMSLEERVQRLLKALESPLVELAQEKAAAEKAVRDVQLLHRLVETWSEILLGLLEEPPADSPEHDPPGEGSLADEEPLIPSCDDSLPFRG
jgi:hypothetical protein